MYVQATEDHLLGGNVTTVSVIQPLRDIPIVGQLIGGVDAFRAEKWAVEVVKAAQSGTREAYLRDAWVIFCDLVTDALTKGLAAKIPALNFLPKTFDKAVHDYFVKPLLNLIAEKLEEHASE